MFHNNDDHAKTLDDSKPKHYHIYVHWNESKKPWSYNPRYMCLLKVVSIVALLLKSSSVVDNGHHKDVWIVESFKMIINKKKNWDH